MSGDNASDSVTLTSQNVFDLSDTHRLYVNGDPLDKVFSQGQGWVQGADDTVDGTAYHTYSVGGASLYVDTDVATIFT